MRRKINLVICLLAMLVTTYAQEKKFFTPEDASYNNYAVYAKRPNQIKWIGSSDAVMKVEDNNIMSLTPGAKKAVTLLTLEQFNEALANAGIDEMKRVPQLTWDENGIAYFYAVSGDVISFNSINVAKRVAKRLVTLPQGCENQTVSLKGNKIAYTIGDDLYVADADKQMRITENKEDVVAGQAVHRNEFGIEGGIFWSPDGNKLAYYLMDQSMVVDYPLVDITQREAAVKKIKYPMAGMTSHQVTLHIYDFTLNKDIAVKTTGPADQYLTSITWNPDGKRIYIGVLNREQNHLMFNEYDATNGELLQTIFEDRDDQYVEPQTPAYFLPNDNNKFVWIAQRDGYNHLYLYDINRKSVKQLTRGNFVITSFDGFDNNGNMYYTSTEVSPLQRHCYVQNIKTGKKSRLTKQHGTHSVSHSASGKYMLDFYNSTEVPYNVDLINAKGDLIERMHEAPNPIADYNIGVTELDSIKSEDGQMLYTRIVKPYNFDPSKKYPVVVYVYGGPHAQLVTDTWLAGAGIYLNYLAQEGFIVFSLDNRGSAARGEAFEQCIHRQCGQLEMRDQMKGIEYLKTKPYIDANRIGSDGWSYGGFMSTSLKINYPETFKVSVAGGPVMDWKYYEIMYGERYMDTPDENPEGYELTSLENKSDKLEGKLLIIHCTTDPVVVWQHSLVFVENCIHNQKQLDYFVYPGHDHNVYGMDRAHLITKITQYFKDNL